MDVFMRDSDAFSWYMERDPILRSTVVAVAWLERSPDWKVFADKLDHATRLIPMFRQRVLEPPGRIASPRWTFDEGFDLSWHLRRIDAPAPHTPATVIEFARQAAMTAFDRSRPLWEFTLIEHLKDGRAAFVMKLHHSLTDGLGGMQLALLLFDTTRDPLRTEAMPEAPLGEHLDTPGLIRESVASSMARVSGLAGRPRRGRVAVGASRRQPAPPHSRLRARHGTLHRPDGRSRPGDALADHDRARPRAAPRHRRSRARRLETSSRGSRWLGQRRLHGGCDRRLAPVSRAPRRRRRLVAGDAADQHPDGRGSDGWQPHHAHPLSGHRLGSGPGSAHSRHGSRLPGGSRRAVLEFTNAIAGALNLLPQGVVGSMLKHVDFLASDVPGFPFPVYLGGARMERYTPFGPTIGASVNMTLLSYDGTCCVGVTLDTAAVPDHDVFISCLREGFEEVLALGGAHVPARLPLHDRPAKAAA